MGDLYRIAEDSPILREARQQEQRTEHWRSMAIGLRAIIDSLRNDPTPTWHGDALDRALAEMHNQLRTIERVLDMDH